ncbi:protein phosphatase Slingshot homolog 2-like isoform X2 [Mytilus californianus]|uniref:protein phosphatase Slingshot homolog 2-like isoform X2 n=1 Tax=Mytilus californianus TaxID=6549 RepID=UPI002246D40C|nr:protein phosphatase Slingshot homolog 2-like isoform X2 [Mytilus californianus]
MALVTVQRSPSPSNTESEDVDTEEGSNLKSPNRSRRRSKSALKRLKKLFHTVRFISKLRPCFSESYFTVKGAALILPQNDVESTFTKKICKSSHGDIQSHLESMIALLRRQDTIALAVKLEVTIPERHKYMAVVSCMGKQDTEETVILGIDFCGNNQATIGLVLPIWADTEIALDGDGGFSVTSGGNRHMFKPVTVHVMWFTLQSLNKLVKLARENKYIAQGLSHTWVSYYESSLTSDIPLISEWNTTEDLLFFKAEPVLLPTDDEEEAFLKRIRVELKNVMMKEDLDEATSKYLRTKVEERMNMKLDQWKAYIEQEMLMIMGQLDSPTLIKEYLYLGSEWNASNIEELSKNGVHYILNISREIDNFYPGILHYYNIKEWDCEETNLLKYWENTHKFISKVREKKGIVLVHCKMGISRSASTVIAYLMKEYHMSRQEAYDMVKGMRSCIMPNNAFWNQLETYEGILNASNQRLIFKLRSETNMDEKAKEIEKEEVNTEDFLGVYQEPIDESYSDVFLKDISDNCSYDFDIEIGSSSRSADSNEEFYPDLPSPQPDGAQGISTDIPDDEDSEDDSESSEEEEEEIPASFPQKSLSPTSKSSSSNIVPEIILSNSPADRPILDTEKVPNETRKDIGESHSDMDIAEIEGDCALETDISRETTPLSDLGIHQHYRKENIPWSAGTVKKTKENLEGKSKDVSASSRSDDIKRKIKDVETSPESSHFSFDDHVTTNNEGITIIVTDESDKQFQPIDDVTQSETNVDEVQAEKFAQKDEDQDVKRPASVYDLEEISLPAGIVRRTTQEIEDRNRINDQSPDSEHKALQRSSSLKTERDTPRKKRNLERRKTITPILSSCSSSSCDASPTKDVSALNFSKYDSVFTSPAVLSRQLDDEKKECEKTCEKDDKTDFVNISANKNDENTEEVKSIELEEADLAVYKFLGEEVSVKKGIVKKQTMGIELMNRERLSSENEKSDVGSRSRRTSDNEGSGSHPTTPTEVKNSGKEVIEVTPSCTISMDTQNKVENVSSESEENKKSSESDGRIEEKTPLFSVAKESFERASAKTKDHDDPVFHTPKNKKRPEPRFDAATLELIREIGSAILNSPAKSEVEDYEEEEAQLGSGLVRHYVRGIEKKTSVSKKKKTKEIIIIDKETQEKKHSWRWSSPPDQNKESPNEHSKKPLIQSNSSPVLSTKQMIQSGKPGSDFDLSPLKGSPPKRGGEIGKSSPKKSVGIDSEYSSSLGSDSSVGAKDGENSEVFNFKSLVGKYGGSCQDCLDSHPNSSSLSEIKEVNSCESLKNVGTNPTPNKETENDSSINTQSDSEESTNEDCVKLRHIRNQLRKTSHHTHRPKSVELVRRHSLAPGMFGVTDTSMEDNQSAFSWEGRKVRKLQGKSHPLTKLEWRKKFYNTM